MAISENRSLVSREEFRAVFDEKIPISYRKKDSYRMFEFKDHLINRLPFVDKPIDLQHFGGVREESGNKVAGVTLILRIGKTSKTFYIKQRISGQNPVTQKLGQWFSNPNNISKFEGKDTIVVREALKRATTWVNNNNAIDINFAHIGNWTIRKYISDKYQYDRKRIPVKNNIIKVFKDESLRNLLSDTTPIHPFKIKDASIEWLDALSKYWSTPKENPSNGLTKFKNLDTQRKAYTVFNAMFSVMSKASYIAFNPFDGEIHRFKSHGEHDEENEVQVLPQSIDTDTAMNYIFTEAKGSIQGKLYLATMLLAGVRNHEVYRNYTKNFKIDDREIFVPASISTKYKKSRTIPIENDIYWTKIEEYLDGPVYQNNKNEQGHFLPMTRQPSKKRLDRTDNTSFHVEHGIMRPTWQSFRGKFNVFHLKPYDLRHTLLTKITKVMGIDEASKYSGNSMKTLNKYYLHHNKEEARPKFSKVQNTQNIKKNESTLITPAEPAVTPSIEDMPTSIVSFFRAFAGGSVRPNDEQIYKSDWDEFVEKIQHLYDNGKLTERDVEDWLYINK